jgi:hypothetical protein
MRNPQDERNADYSEYKYSIPHEAADVLIRRQKNRTSGKPFQSRPHRREIVADNFSASRRQEESQYSTEHVISYS